MKLQNLTPEMAEKAVNELQKSGYRFVQIRSNLPEGTFTGNFLTQEVDKIKKPVIDVIPYTDANGIPSFFVSYKVNITETETGKKYQDYGIGQTEEIKEICSNPETLVKEYDFVSKMGRTRTFLNLAS